MMKAWMMRVAATAALVVGWGGAWAGILPGPVVDSAWLAANLDKVQVVDVRSSSAIFTRQPEFDSDPKSGKIVLSEPGGHIAGARLIDMKTMRTERQMGALKVKYMIPERATFELAVRAAGIDAGKPIVLVPVGVEVPDMDDALRVYWQFKVYGEDQLAVLDGGLAGWLNEGRPVSTAPDVPRQGSWKAGPERAARYFAGIDDVAAAHGAGLIDARDIKSYLGLVKRDYVYGYGHLEGARLYAPELMFASSGGALRFMSANTYAALFKAQGIDPAAPAISYCNSGHLSSGPWFVLSELLGNTKARLYDGSLHEWTMAQRPLAGAVPLR
ncbi:MAG TPA: rhodanese-like domain-containing protein [Telluria sp.]|nr:rhodanese-like domain-containing protein [Telluria sp.]